MNNSPGSRRDFLMLLPLGIIAGVFATVATAAFRFLRPVRTQTTAEWIDVGRIDELVGTKPISRKVTREYVAGWIKSREQSTVYILPAGNNKVVSAICPHEGCEVAWSEELDIFACPCHDSNFTAEGARLNGPAPRGLDLLPSRVENGVLQIRRTYLPNDDEGRITRG